MGISIQPIFVRFQATGVPQTEAAFKQVGNAAKQTGAAVSSTFVTAQGRISALGRSSITAANATGFAISQLVSTGQVGFKSLASATAGFASFFGGAGLIATGVISTGLVLADFWNRQRKEIEETRKKFEDEADAAIRSRLAKDDPVGVAITKRAEAIKQVNALREEMARAIESRDRRLQTASNKFDRAIVERDFEKRRVELAGQITAALNRQLEFERQINDARAKVAEATKKETKEVESLNKAQAKLIDTLVGLSKFEALRFADVATLTTIEASLRKELDSGNITLERRLEILERLAKIAPITNRARLAERLLETDLGRPEVGIASSSPTAPSKLIAPNIPPVRRAAQELGEEFSNTFAESVAQGLGEGLARGLQVALRGEDDFFGALGKALLASLGNEFIQLGSKMLAGGILSLNPDLAARGTALIALGATMGAAGSGGQTSGFSGGGFSGNTADTFTPVSIQRLVTDPNLRQPVHARETSPFSGRPLVVGSPEGQRVLTDAVSRGRQRGMR